MKTKSGVKIYSNSTADKLRDIEEQLTKMLSEQWQKEIDRNILKSLGLEPDRNKRRKNSINKIYKNES
jgi:hypothetical protein